MGVWGKEALFRSILSPFPSIPLLERWEPVGVRACSGAPTPFPALLLPRSPPPFALLPSPLSPPLPHPLIHCPLRPLPSRAEPSQAAETEAPERGGSMKAAQASRLLRRTRLRFISAPFTYPSAFTPSSTPPTS